MKRILRRAMPIFGAALCLVLFGVRLTADTITVPIVAAFDDMEENLDDGTQDTGSSDIELNTEGPPDGPRQIVGLRFVDLGIPALSTINSASIQFMVDEDDNEVTNVRIYGELAANSAPFVDVVNNLSSLTRTSNSVVWSDIPVWAGEGTSGPDQRTPDLSPIIQEIIGQPGWAAGNALSLLIFSEPESDNTGERTAISFEKANGTANFNPAILNVDFTAIPEPSSWIIAAVGALSLAAFGKRRR
jgi:titin